MKRLIIIGILLLGILLTSSLCVAGPSSGSLEWKEKTSGALSYPYQVEAPYTDNGDGTISLIASDPLSWLQATAQTGLTGNKTGSFNLTTTGLTNTGQLIISNPTVPANSNSVGTTGTVAWDSSYIYVCVSTDTWVRYAKTTWTSIPPTSGMPIGMMMGLLYD